MLDEVVNSFTVSGTVQPQKKKSETKSTGSTEDKVRKITADLLDLDPTVIKLESSFTKDLGADSLDTVELVMSIEEEFGLEIPDAEAMKMQTVGELVRWIDQKPAK
ncbi:MAG: acyl carrier protein [Verrucomicrobiales bacterium VVV1]|nr:MAG: acyl carrier protein [Verrucomicrobiales bacterium VVV1]